MRPIRILELRSVVGSGGGPEKTILYGTAQTNPEEFAITVCYIRDLRDAKYDLDRRASALGVDYAEVTERHSFDPVVWPRLTALCREKQIDIVHSHEHKTDLLAWLLGRRTRIIPMATAHGWTGHSWKERRLYYPADKWLLARFPRVIAVSNEIRDELVRHGTKASSISVVLNGIDPTHFRRRPELRDPVRGELGLPRDAFVIGSVGRLEPQKRFDLLIDAVAGIRKRRPDVYLAIAGDGSLRHTLAEQIRSLGLEEGCRLLGHQPDVQKVHQALDLFVQASDYEGTSNAVLEAMAMETPVIATDAGGTAEQVEHDIHGIVVGRGHASVIEKAISELIGDPARMERFRRAARLRIEGPLSFEARMRAVEQIYRDVLGAGRSAGA